MARDFWDEFGGVFAAPSMDSLIQGRTLEGSSSHSVRDLTDKSRAANALQEPVAAGTRVSFVTNLGSVLTYPDIPDEGVLGTVVTVRTGNGDATSWNDHVMVSWDDGKFRPIQAEHLRLASLKSRRAHAYRITAGSLGDLTEFFAPSRTGSNDLVHKATKDLWSFHEDKGSFVIERLFNEDGNPLHGV